MKKYLRKSDMIFNWLVFCLIKVKPRKKIVMKNYVQKIADFSESKIENNAWWDFALMFIKLGFFLFFGVYVLEGFEHALESAIIAACFSLEIVGIFRLYVWLSNQAD